MQCRRTWRTRNRGKIKPSRPGATETKLPYMNSETRPMRSHRIREGDEDMIMEGAFRSMRVPMYCADGARLEAPAWKTPLQSFSADSSSGARTWFQPDSHHAGLLLAHGSSRTGSARGTGTAFAHRVRNARSTHTLYMRCNQRHAPDDSQRRHGTPEAIIMMACSTTSSWNPKPRHLTPCLDLRLAGSAKISTPSE